MFSPSKSLPSIRELWAAISRNLLGVQAGRGEQSGQPSARAIASPVLQAVPAALLSAANVGQGDATSRDEDHWRGRVLRGPGGDDQDGEPELH